MDSSDPSVSPTPSEARVVSLDTPEESFSSAAAIHDLSPRANAHSTSSLEEPTAPGLGESAPLGVYLRPHRRLRFITIGAALAACVSLSIVASHQPTAQDPISSIDKRYGHVTIPLGQLPHLQLNVAGALPAIVAVNGRLDVQGSLVLAPIAQPAVPIPGQLYFDQTSNQLSYFNGKAFTTVLTSSALPPQQSNLSAGGVSLANGLLTNAGVLTLQGKSGDVRLTAGPGLRVVGTEFSNTGVLTLGGLNGDVVLGNGLSVSDGKLNSTGIQSISASGSLNVTDDGQGNYTITGPMGVGLGNVSASGGTSGSIAVFNGAQAITDSLLSETATSVTVAGDLSVSGVISATSYSGDGANVTNVNAVELNGQTGGYYTSASNISGGTLSDARLSINVPLLDGGDNFTGTLQHNGNTLCDTSGNCVGVSGGSIGGSGAANKLALFTGTGLTIGNSLLSQDVGATTVTASGNVVATGSVTATSFSGNGASITNLDASNLASGTVDDARLSGDVALKNAAANFTGSLQHSGNDVCDISGNCTSNLSATNVTSGTLNDTRLSTDVTLQGNTFNGGSQLVQLTGGGLLPTLDGSSLTNVDSVTLQGNASSYFTNASNINSGSLNDARLSNNVALLNTSETFSGILTLSASGTAIIITNSAYVGGVLTVVGGISTSTLTYDTSIQSSCASLTGYIWVPGSAKFGTLPGFCVMKYAASNDGSGNAVSVPGAAPWTSISQRSAEDVSSAVCNGCHLLTDQEWMTIATNALWLAANWCNSDGNGCGNTPGAASKYLAAGQNDSGVPLAASGNDSEACYGTVTPGTNTACGNTGTQKRTLTLSNGNVIWDIGGNVWEWTDAWVQDPDEPSNGGAGFSYIEYTGVKALNGLPYIMPTNRGWNSTQHLGQLYTDNNAGNGNNQYSLRRGGNSNSTTAAGAFALRLDSNATYSGADIGFRVAR